MIVRRLPVALTVALALWTGDSRAARTQTWTADAADLMGGSAEGVAVTQRARVFAAPRLTRSSPAGGSSAAYGWAIFAAPRGIVFAATGAGGGVLRGAPGGEFAPAFTAGEPMVTAILPLSGGAFLAAVAPGGRIYRISPDGHSEVWCETGERYVWSLAPAGKGSVYAATGDRGVLLRIDRDGKAEPFFDCDEPHLTALLVLADGTVVAGSAGSGLIFRITPAGAASVWYDGDLSEVADLAAAPDGSIVAGYVAAPDADPRPPAVRIQLPQTGARGAGEPVGGMDERSAPTLEGVIEGLPAAADRGAARRSRGRLIRIFPNGSARELWRSSAEAVFAVSLDSAGRPVFGTGEPARLYRIGDDSEVERLATLPEGQLTALSAAGGEFWALTSNPASIYRIEPAAAARGSFVSEPIDAGAPARWGPLVWGASAGEGPAGLTAEVRTGNSAEPDGTWSAWMPAAGASDTAHPPPDGRFLQWRVDLSRLPDPSVRFDRFAVSYTPYNRPPSVDSFRIDDPKLAFSDKVPFRFSSSDPDGDRLVTEIQYRVAGEYEWRTAIRIDPPGDDRDSEAAESDGRGTWDVASLAEGRYEVRALASDAVANRAGEGFSETSPRILRVIVDRTPPEVRAHRSADGSYQVDATDTLSTVNCLEVTQEGRAVHTILSADGVCDGTTERFEVHPDDTGPPEGRSFRLADAAGNTTTVGIPGR